MMNTNALFALVLVVAAPLASAFAPVAMTSSRRTAMKMAEDDKSEPTLVQSTLKKNIAYDEATGRFFESNLSDECVPEDEFCITDSSSGELIRLTVEEKERIFLDSLQAYYSSGRQLLSDEEFDMLKEDLTWTGSSLVSMNRKEAKYLAAMQEYLKGTPSMSDSEFDQLKKELLEDGSPFAVQTEPKCYIDSGICKVTMQEDNFKSNLLYLPAGAAIAAVWLAFSYELIEPLIRINPLFLLAVGSPFIYSGGRYVTEELVFFNNKVARGPCPSCGAENTIYFGDILGVEGFTDLATVKCPNCKTTFNVQRDSLRASTLPK